MSDGRGGLGQELFDLPPPPDPSEQRADLPAMRVDTGADISDRSGGGEALEDIGDLGDAFAPPPTGGR